MSVESNASSLEVIKANFSTYTNTLGFVSNEPNGSSGNDLMYSCEAAIIRKLLNAWTEQDEQNLINSIEKEAKLQDGLYARPGWKQDEEQPDDYYALVAWNTTYAKLVAEYGSKTFWCKFKTSDTSKFYEPWFWRFPGLICHTKWASGQKPNIFLRLWWCLSVAFTGSKDTQDTWIINWLLTTVAGDKGFLERLATKRYIERRTQIWGSLKAVFQAYFEDKNHPLSVYCPI